MALQKHSGFKGIGDIDQKTNSKKVLFRTHTPASAGAAGTAGEITWDANFIYVCIAANTWKRVAIAAW